MEHRFETVAQALRRLMDEGVFPCANLEIGDRNGPVYRFSEGFRALSPQALPVDADTLFDMASVSKILSVTMIALRLAEQGRLSLEDAMDRYYQGLPEASRGITIRQLLTHSSGIPGTTSIVGKPAERIDEEILSMPPAYPKGTTVQYACLGFIALGRLLERIAGERLDSLAERLVFAPLGMSRTGYAPKGDNIAATMDGPDFLGVVNDYNARYLGAPVGNAGVFSSLRDCGIFARMLLGGGAYGGARVLAPATLAVAAEDHTPGTGEGRGLGFYRFRRGTNPPAELLSREAFGHSGWTGTSIVADPMLGLYVVLLTNRTLGENKDPDAIWRARRLVHNAAAAAMTA